MMFRKKKKKNPLTLDTFLNRVDLNEVCSVELLLQ